MKTDPFQPRTWKLAHGKSLELGPVARLMGILNVTPDSFSDGGKFETVENAIDRAAVMIEQGAHIIDVGGESTKPGAKSVTILSEQQRVLPVIEAIAKRFDTLISIDTYHAQTAQLAIVTGAHLVNDVWGLQFDDDMAEVISAHKAGACIMHNSRLIERDKHQVKRITRQSKRDNDQNRNQLQFLNRSISIADNAGIGHENLVLDPGFGFGKDAQDNLQLLDNLAHLHSLGLPLLAGTSRKRFTGTILAGNDTMENRDIVTSATSVIARMAGCAIFRVHDIATNKYALQLADGVINTRR